MDQVETDTFEEGPRESSNDYSKFHVTKRDGSLELIDLSKITKVVNWAAEGLSNVSPSLVELRAKIQFTDGIKTSDIHETLIKAAADLISEDTPNYQYLAARLAIFHIKKIAFGDFREPKLYDHVKKLVDLGVYDPELLKMYSREEFDILDGCIDHKRDMNFAYAAVVQMQSKYLAQNRVTHKVYESPQFLYMLVSMCLFGRYPKDTRLDYVRRFYDHVSLFKISLPTPIMSGVRTPTRQFSSCVLIECDDDLESIGATVCATLRYISQRAGVGINIGRIRSAGSPIRGGEAKHMGCVPFIRLFQSAVKSCSQGGVRGGAATLFYPIWHAEFEDLIVLRNNRGVEDNRARHVDYGVQVNKLFYERLQKNENITLFNPNDTPDLYNAFFSDQEVFRELYERYEKDPSVKKIVFPAVDVFRMLIQERAETGRIFIQNIDHCNTHSSFDPKVAPVRQSNLCMEITLPTKPIYNVDDPNGEIALCTLSALNLGLLENDEDMAEACDLTVRALDELLDYQHYPVPAAENANKKRRALGVGVINYAYFLAKNGLKFSDGSAYGPTHRIFESFQYHLLRASCRLAEEKGPCLAFNETKYAQGLLPIDHYRKTVDKYCAEPLRHDWEGLRADILAHGLRNSCLSALMPSETSSQISNATSGIDPVRDVVSHKQSKDGNYKQVAPEIGKLGDKYELLWDLPNMDSYLRLIGVMQKFIDQSISANTRYDPAAYEGNMVPMKQMIRDLLLAYQCGVKTLYYHHVRDGSRDKQSLSVDDCASGACKI